MSMGIYNWKTGNFDRSDLYDRNVYGAYRTNGQKVYGAKKWDDILNPNNHFLQVQILCF